MQLLKNIFKYLVYIFLIIFLGFFCLTLFGFNFGVVVSNSMQPVLTKGDLVLINSDKSVKPGDIIAFNEAGVGVIIHRVLRVAEFGGKTYYLCAGDNNDFLVDLDAGRTNLIGWRNRAEFLNAQPTETAMSLAENVVEYNNIVGTAIVRFNNLGNVAIILNNKLIIFVLILLTFIFTFKNKKNI